MLCSVQFVLKRLVIKRTNGILFIRYKKPSSTVCLILEGNEGPTESLTNDVTSENTQQNDSSADHSASTSQPNTSQVPQTPPPSYSPWQCVDAYRPRPMPSVPSDRPPIPRGIPPPPYQGIQLGPVPAAEQQSISDEPPPEYPGPPQVFNPAGPAPVHYPTGSRLATALEQERRREIGRLLVL